MEFPEHVLVHDPLAGMATGLVTQFRSRGVDADTLSSTDGLPRWMTSTTHLLVATLDPTVGWPLLEKLHADGMAGQTIALLDVFDSDDVVRALGCGARMVAARSADPADIVDVALRAFGGQAVLPLDLLHRIVRRARPADVGQLTGIEVSWLRLLATGATTQHLAEAAGYSERAMFRLLHDLYVRLGATNRQQALITASQWGLLDADTP